MIYTMQQQIKVRAVIMRENKLLSVKHKDYDTGETRDFWSVPGGGVDEGEALLAAVHREMIEETNIAPEIGNLLFIQQFTDSETEVLEFFFHVKNAEDYATIDLSQTTHGEAEIAEIKFIDPSKETILPKFLTTEPLMDIVNNPGPTKIIFYEAE